MSRPTSLCLNLFWTSREVRFTKQGQHTIDNISLNFININHTQHINKTFVLHCMRTRQRAVVMKTHPRHQRSTKNWTSLHSLNNAIYSSFVMLVAYTNEIYIPKEHQRVVVDATGLWHIARSTWLMCFLWPDNDIEKTFTNYSVIIVQTNFLCTNKVK